MMKRKINLLFVSFGMSIGGIQKSLTELINNIDYDKYNVNLLLYETKGELIKELNSNVKVIEFDINLNIPVFSLKTIKQDLKFAYSKNLLTGYFKTILFTKNKKSRYFKENFWKYFQKIVPNMTTSYDVVI